MTETYPDDASLLAITSDPSTGVEYIPTGQSPYILAYRRMLYRMLRATERANDLRVYAVAGLQVGVRGGRCFVGDQPRAVPAVASIELTPDATTHLYVDTAGQVQASTSGLPADRAGFIPLAEVVCDATSVTQIDDLRGESFLQAQSAALSGITAQPTEINQALDGIATDVTAANLNILTAGATSTADSQHRHLNTNIDTPGLGSVSINNFSSDTNANVALLLSLPSLLPDATRLQVDRSNGFLQQSYLNQTSHFVGATTIQFTHAGPLTTSTGSTLIGAIPIAGEVIDVVLSTRLNTQSSDSNDGLRLDASVNGAALTTSPATLTTSDGSGFRSTDQGDGQPASITTSGSQSVTRGDLISIDLSYIGAGTITQQPTDVAALVVIKASAPI